MNHCANFAGDRFDVVNLSNILDRLNFIYVWMDRVEWEGIAAAATAEKTWRRSGVGWRENRNHGQSNRTEENARRAR